MSKVDCGGVFLGAALLLLGAAGCGGDGDGGGAGGTGGGAGGTSGGNVAACGIAPCGGDLLGTWNLTDFCVPPGSTPAVSPDIMAGCPGFRYGPVRINLSGSFTFNADLTYAGQLTAAYEGSFIFPASCLNGMSCADVDAALKQVYAGDPEVQSVACGGSPDCTCTIMGPPTPDQESGTYAVSANTLTTTPTGETPDVVQYCVQGSTLVLRDNETGDSAIIGRR